MLQFATLLVVGFSTPSYDPTGGQILQRMQEMYAHLRSYQDTGSVACGAESLSFKTAYKSPGKLYFEYREHPGPFEDRCVLWATGKRGLDPESKSGTKPVLLASAYLGFGKRDTEIEVDRALESEIAGFVGISLGTASTVPSMLIPEVNHVYGFRAPKDSKLVRRESLGATECFVVASSRENTTFWIDAKTYALRKVDEPLLSERQITTYEPVLNPSLDDVAFEFTPPKATERVERPVAQGADGSNALELYRLATSGLKDEKDLGQSIWNSSAAPNKITDEFVKAVEKNKPALGMISRAVGMKLTLPERTVFDPQIEVSNWMIRSARFARACGEAAYAQGRLSEALADYELAFRIGSQLLKAEAEPISVLAGTSAEAIGRYGLESLFNDPKAPRFVESANLLLDESRRHKPCAEVIRIDIRVVADYCVGLAAKAKSNKEREVFGSPKALRAAMDLRIRSLDARYSRPFSTRNLVPAKKIEGKIGQTVDGFIDVSMYDGVMFASLVNDGRDRLLALKLAALAYRSKYSKWPEKINDLVPDCLRTVPDDPFQPFKPIGMLSRGSDLVFYCLGPDGIDDHGAPMDRKAGSEAKGDLVLVVKAPN